MQLVGLSDGVALLVVVLANGSIEKRTITIADDLGDERLAAATAHLSAHLVGRTFGSVDANTIPATGDPATDAVVTAAANELHATDDGDLVYVGGASHMADAFDAVETVRRVLGILEQQLVVVNVIRDVLDRGLQVAIGSETGLETLAECSIVVAPYEVDGEPAGSIGVLGPTRMNYPQALTAVAVVSKRLSRHLTEG